MLSRRARLFLLLLYALLVAACGGGGGRPGFTGGGTAPETGTGTLALVIANLPSGVGAQVRVTGPGNFTQELAQSQTLVNLAPGDYSISAASVAVGASTYSPSPPTQAAAVKAGSSASATVTYATAPMSLALVEVASGLDSPIFLTAPEGDPRQFIVERGGRIRVRDNGSVLAKPFLDIGARVATDGEGGLLSLAFDPRYAVTGHFYVVYTDLQHNIVVERLRASANPNLADATSGLVILRIAHPLYTNHFGGLAAFGPDGYLYLGAGDGGGAGDPPGNAQNLNELLGKLLRIDVSGATALQPYTIPPTNPYGGQAGRRAEIWASGLRNPWRFAFDGPHLYIADDGQDRREEVNIAATTEGGLNYGWNRMEGSLCFNAAACERTGLTLPAFEYDDGVGEPGACAIIGGFVYRGQAIPELGGHYLYSDFCGGFLRSFFATPNGVVAQRDWPTSGLVGPVVSFGRDGQGELYLVSASGRIYKIGRSFSRKG
jgi:glucose/arabinose dehydrogenase